MILLIFLFSLSLLVYQTHYKETKYYPLLTILIPLIFFAFFLIEVGVSSLSYFVSDEISYWDGSFNIIDLHKLDRLFWFIINYCLKHFDIGGIVAVKLINIPILVFILYMLWSMFFKDKRIFLLVLVLPYFALVATKNLRDTGILFFMVASIYVFHKVRHGKILFLIPIFFLLISRPFMGAVCLIVILFNTLFSKYFKGSFKRFRFTFKKKMILYFVAILLGLFMLKSIPYVDKRLNSYYYYFTYNTTGEGYQRRLIERGGISTGHATTDYLVGAVRYIFTPIPTSIIKRGLSGGTEDWGVIDDIIRTINQVFYYYLLLYVFVNFKKIYLKFKLLEPYAKQLLYVLLLYLPLYTFYGFGTAHQRNKLPFQLAIFLLFILNKNFKKKNDGTLIKCD